MARWDPDSRTKLRDAAVELFEARGYAVTTVAEIAARAGVTERTFFRHYADKREVLFGGSDALSEALVSAVAAAPAGASPLEAAAAGVAAAGEVIPSEPASSRRRQAIIDANPELQERELIKLARLADGLAEALVARGVSGDAARLTAEVGIAVFKVAFERWLEPGDDRPFADLVDQALEELATLSA